MATKIRISYERPQELHAVMEMLKPILKTCKAKTGENGQYKKAYLEVIIPEGNMQKSADTPLI